MNADRVARLLRDAIFAARGNEVKIVVGSVKGLTPEQRAGRMMPRIDIHLTGYAADAARRAFEQAEYPIDVTIEFEDNEKEHA